MTEKPVLNLYIAEQDRCAFGRGWEAKRRGQPLASNPFHEVGHWKWQAWRDGWMSFRVSEAYK